jgi:hypothetical protein
MALTAAGAGRGLLINAGATTEGVYIISGAAAGLRIAGATHGIEVAASAGPGVEIDGTTFGIDVGASAGSGLSIVSGGGNGHGVTIAGNGTGDGMNVVAGASGDGIVAQGGSTVGTGIVTQANQATSTGGSGIAAYGYGTNGYGIHALGGSISGAAILTQARANNDAGLQCVKHGTGKDIDADELLTAAAVNDEILDCLQTDTPVDGKTIQSALRIIAAVCAGKISGAPTGTEVFKGLDGSTTRATVVVDADGNRTAVTYV